MDFKKYRIHFIIGSALLVVGTISFIAINKRRKGIMADKINDILDGALSETDLKNEQISSLADLKFPLKIGNLGRQVADVQKAMNKKYGLSLKVDGKFGEDTAKALCKYYFASCSSYVPMQWSLYTVSADDYNSIVNK